MKSEDRESVSVAEVVGQISENQASASAAGGTFPVVGVFLVMALLAISRLSPLHKSAFHLAHRDTGGVRLGARNK
jgi:hypothetical protein